ncbi:MAG: desulfoferrodoxin [Chloroflexi bacterium]|jgi:desulfoferrodoxin-like iron-binding protein|nr:desulfoferrodoxin [Chloroflexota bacterium]MBT7080980.1 desulfoferrodoxin [Chloroflexota bacterium]MBT7290543.1 desulfoferrodoxin [Chloroflexota bacterium]
MATTKKGEKYYCTRCGHEVLITKEGYDQLICCAIPMKQVRLK